METNILQDIICFGLLEIQLWSNNHLAQSNKMPIYKDPALVLCYCLVVSRRVKLEFAYFVQFYDARCEKRFVYLNGTTRSRSPCIFMQPNRYIFRYIFQYLLIQWQCKPSSDRENAKAVMDLLYPHIEYEPFFIIFVIVPYLRISIGVKL